jgi:hypothetical protein
MGPVCAEGTCCFCREARAAGSSPVRGTAVAASLRADRCGYDLGMAVWARQVRWRVMSGPAMATASPPPQGFGDNTLKVFTFYLLPLLFSTPSNGWGSGLVPVRQKIRRRPGPDRHPAGLTGMGAPCMTGQTKARTAPARPGAPPWNDRKGPLANSFVCIKRWFIYACFRVSAHEATGTLCQAGPQRTGAGAGAGYTGTAR